MAKDIETIGEDYPTAVPTMASDANIQDALKVYHYGVKDPESGVPDLNNSIEAHFANVNERVDELTVASSGGQVSNDAPVTITDGTTTVPVPSGYLWVDLDAPGSQIEIPFYINAQTTSYTLVISDSSKMIEMDVATANDLTIPHNGSVAFPIGTRIRVTQVGSGQTTLVAGSGVTINSLSGNKKIAGQYGVANLYKRGIDEWVLYGDLAA